ncbi:MAG TPA: tetratricopeptide repeat protein [Stellaceae bacterium]|nr:tetratricopeptide repeat protein [Stellaceae bacterium]
MLRHNTKELAYFTHAIWPKRKASAEALARQAVTLDPADAQAHAFLAITLMLGGDHEGALTEAEQALAINPNLARAHGSLGATLIFSGRPQERLAALRTCIRLDPLDSEFVIRWLQVAQAYYFSHEYEAAVEAATRAVRTFPNYPTAYRWLAPALGQLGRTEEANATLAS